jgi:hypothetical protein
MNNKNIKQVAAVTLKHFFDLDISFFSSMQAVTLAFISICRLYILQVLSFFTDGWHTVRYDALEIKAGIAEYREHWMNSDIRYSLTEGFRTVKTNVIGKEYTPGH